MRRGKCVEVLYVRALRAVHRTPHVVAVHRSRKSARALAGREPRDDLQERGVALTGDDGVDRGVAREHLVRERCRVRTAHDHVSARAARLDQA